MIPRVPLLLGCLAAAGCAGGGSSSEPFPMAAFETSIMFLGLELPEAGSDVGGHYGPTNLRTSTYHLQDGTRLRWTQAAGSRGEALLRAVGFRVHNVSPSGAAARAIYNVQYGLSGQVHVLSVRTRGGEPYLIEVQCQVGWELLDLGSGTAVFGREIETTTRATGEIDVVVALALDQAMSRLLADDAFRNAIAVPRSVPGGDAPAFRRAIPGPSEPFIIGLGEQLFDSLSGPTPRITAGIVLLRGRDYPLGTAFVITRDGLAIADARAVRSMDRVRARLPSGIDRPVRLLRRGGSLDVALIQVACPGECVTVDWEAPDAVPVFTNVIAVGAPFRDGEPPTVSTGRVGGRWGIAQGITLEGMESIEGGEPVGRASSGKVFGVVTVRRGRRAVLMLDEVFRSLRIQLTAGTSRPGT